MSVYQLSMQPIGSDWSLIPYLSISLSLNVLLTLMIVIRLTLHVRNTRTILGETGVGGLCKAIVIILVESCALHAVNSLLVIGPLGADNHVVDIFTPILGETQVRVFSQLRSPDRLSNNATTDRTGHRPTAHHSPSRKQKRVDDQRCPLRTYQRVQGKD